MSQDWIKRSNGFQKRLDLDLDSAFCIDLHWQTLMTMMGNDDNDVQCPMKAMKAMMALKI